MSKVLLYAEGWGRGGIERFIMNVLPRLRADGNEFSVFTTHAWAHAYDDQVRALGGTVSTIFDGFKPGLARRMAVSTAAWRARIQSWHPDVVHCNIMNGMGLQYVAIARAEGVPVRIAHSHNTAFGSSHALVKSVFHAYGRARWASAATVRLACNEQAGCYLFGSSPFELMPNGTDVARFRFSSEARSTVRGAFGISDETLAFGNVGRISEAKNPTYLVDVLRELLALGVDAVLVLVGAGELDQAVRAAAEQAGLSDRLVMPGATDTPEHALAALDAFVLPSTFEGTPMAVVEAASCGCPLVLSDALPDCGLPVADGARMPVGDARAWAEAVRAAAAKTDPGTRAAAWRTVAGGPYDARTSAERMLRLYAGAPMRPDSGCRQKDAT